MNAWPPRLTPRSSRKAIYADRSVRASRRARPEGGSKLPDDELEPDRSGLKLSDPKVLSPCWCGRRNRHDWPGRDQGAKHPAERRPKYATLTAWHRKVVVHEWLLDHGWVNLGGRVEGRYRKPTWQDYVLSVTMGVARAMQQPHTDETPKQWYYRMHEE